MLPITLTDDQWQRILPFLRSHRKVYVGAQWSCRRFLEAVLWVSRSGAQWRLLPREYGNWNSIYKRFARWCEQGVWENLHEYCVSEPDLEHFLIDRDHCARSSVRGGCAQKKHGDQDAQALGRSRGGFSTKIHIAVDALGNPLRLILTAGQEADVTHGAALIKDFEVQAVIADKGYDADELVKTITAQQAQAVIPPRSNRTKQREYDRHLYRERHLVECFISKIKHYRRVFSRFEKLSKNYMGFLSFVSALIWLR